MSGIMKATTKLVGSVLGLEAPAPVDALQVPPSTAAAAEPKPVMPTPDDEAMKASRKRSISAQKKRMGRASTILTGDEPLGG